MVKQAPAPGVAGAASARDAVAAFLDGVKAEDLQAMSAVWGTPDGLARDQMSRTVLEEREYIIVRCLRHDKYTILSDASALEGRRVLNVQLSRGSVTRLQNFYAVMGPQGRWFFEKTDLDKLSEMCSAK